MDEAALAQPPSPPLQGRVQRIWRQQHPLGPGLRHYVRSQKRKRGQRESKGIDVLSSGHQRSSPSSLFPPLPSTSLPSAFLPPASLPPTSRRYLVRVSIFCHCRSRISLAMTLPASSPAFSCNSPLSRFSLTSTR